MTDWTARRNEAADYSKKRIFMRSVVITEALQYCFSGIWSRLALRAQPPSPNLQQRTPSAYPSPAHSPSLRRIGEFLGAAVGLVRITRLNHYAQQGLGSTGTNQNPP